MLHQRGFSLIELVVTVAIVGILASTLLPLGSLTVKRSKEAELRTALREIRQGLDAYKRAYDEGRIEKSVDASGYPPNLAVLVQGVPDASDPKKAKLYFMRRLPRDPWFPDPAVPAAETWGKRSYASPPDDPQTGNDVFDVYSLSTDSGINGIPYRLW